MSGSAAKRQGPPVPIKIPTNDDQRHSIQAQSGSASRPKSVSRAYNRLTPGHNSIDVPPRGAASLALGPNNKRRAQVPAIAESSFYSGVTASSNLTSYTNGAPPRTPQTGSKARSPTSQANASEYRPHYRNARQQPQERIFGRVPPHFLLQTPRSSTRDRKNVRVGMEKDDGPIELTDSEDEGKQLTSKGKAKASSVIFGGSSDLSSSPSEHGENRSSVLPPSPGGQNASARVQLANDALGDGKEHSEDEQERSGKRPSTSVVETRFAEEPRAKSSLLPLDRNFVIAKPEDESTLARPQRFASRMKNKNGEYAPLSSSHALKPLPSSSQARRTSETKSMVPSSTHFRFNWNAEHLRDRKLKETVDLSCLAFLGFGKLIHQDRPKAMMSTATTLKLEWTLAGSVEPNSISLDLNIVEAVDVAETQSRVIKITALAQSAPFIAICDAFLVTPKQKWKTIDVILKQGFGDNPEPWIALKADLRTTPHYHTLAETEIKKVLQAIDASGRLPDAVYEMTDSDSAADQAPKKPQQARPKPRPSARSWATPMLTRSASRPESPSSKRVESPPKQVLCYPLTGARGVTIFQSDVDKLEEGEFLNDTIIEFGLKYLLEQIKKRDPELHEQIYVFSSFFYKRYAEKKNGFQAGYELVRKWTNKVQLFKKKYLVVPINENLHWYLAIVVNPLFAFRNEPRAETAVRMLDGQHAIHDHDKRELSNESHSAAFSETTDDREKSSETLALPGFLQDKDGDTMMSELGVASSSRLVQVEDRRSQAGGSQRWRSYSGPSDGIHNEGQGSLSGGGDKRPITSIVSVQETIADGDKGDGDEVNFVKQSHRKRARGQSAESSISSRPPSPEMTILTRRSSQRLSGNEPSWSNYPPLESLFANSPKRGPTREDRREWLEHGATVLVFDSLLGKHTAVRTALQNYLQLEMKDKHDVENDLANVKLEFIQVMMPKQNNYADCGLYLLHSFDRFFSDPELFKTEVIPARDAKHPEWRAEEAMARRTWCRELLASLAKEWQEEAGRRREENRLRKEREGVKDSSDMSDTTTPMGDKEEGEASEEDGTADGATTESQAATEGSMDPQERTQLTLGFSQEITKLTAPRDK